MESIKSFKNQKIQNMQNITGGRNVRPTNSGSATDPSASPDKQITYNDGSTKTIENLGFVNWITGNRTVTTGYVGKENVWVND